MQEPEHDPQPAPRILVAEDTVLEAMTVVDVVRGLGCEPVGPVASPAEVIEAVDNEQVNAAVLDVDLRGGLVFEAADDLAGRGIPFLFVTGYDRQRFPPRFRHAPRLDKPYVRPQLETELMQLLKRAREAAQPERRCAAPGRS